MKKKFKISCNWDSDINITNRFINNYVNETNKDLVLFTYDNDYDYHIVFNYSNSMINDNKTHIFIQEPSWSSHIKKHVLLTYKNIHFHDKNLLPLNGVIETPSLMLNSFNEKLSDIIKTNITKKKHISFICSSIGSGHNYDYRKRLFNTILNSDLNIDLYGYGWTNVLDKRYKGAIQNKKDGLLDYEFSISIENSSEIGYVSEKFFDCVIYNTIPIYFGSPNINDIYNKKGFILLNGEINKDLSLLKDIKNYNEYLEYNNINKQKYIKDYNIINYVNNWYNNI